MMTFLFMASVALGAPVQCYGWLAQPWTKLDEEGVHAEWKKQFAAKIVYTSNSGDCRTRATEIRKAFDAHMRSLNGTGKRFVVQPVECFVGPSEGELAPNRERYFAKYTPEMIEDFVVRNDPTPAPTVIAAKPTSPGNFLELVAGADCSPKGAKCLTVEGCDVSLRGIMVPNYGTDPGKGFSVTDQGFRNECAHPHRRSTVSGQEASGRWTGQAAARATTGGYPRRVSQSWTLSPVMVS